MFFCPFNKSSVLDFQGAAFLWLHRETLHSNFLPGCKKGFFSGTIPNEMTGEF